MKLKQSQKPYRIFLPTRTQSVSDNFVHVGHKRISSTSVDTESVFVYQSMTLIYKFINSADVKMRRSHSLSPPPPPIPFHLTLFIIINYRLLQTLGQTQRSLENVRIFSYS